jgi:hypothetical protein
MKQTIIGGVLAFAVALVAPQITQAQGTTYLSNLGQAPAGSIAVGSDSWVAGNFRTGTNSAGYVLNSVQLAMTDASGNPDGFTAMIYTQFGFPVGAPHPESSLATLGGSLNPMTAGDYTYAPASSLMLSPNTIYFIVLTGGTGIASGAYEWSDAGVNSYNPSDGWGGSIYYYHSSDGLNWTRSLGIYPQFAINGTAVPEPGVFSLFALGGLGFLWHRRRQRGVSFLPMA